MAIPRWVLRHCMGTALPRAIREGSRLGIIAPAGPFDIEAFDRGIAWLRDRYEVIYRPDIYDRDGYFAGSDERRLEELKEAIANPDIDAILCARGGYGSTRLLPALTPKEVSDSAKLLIGFSDVTALHSLWRRAGVPSIHAPMVAAIGGASPAIQAKWIETIENPGQSLEWDLERLCNPSERDVTGTLFGGNLAVLTALNGTGYLPDLEDIVLFLEDVGERPYRIDRMLTTLGQSGWFEKIRGIVLGAFTEGDPGPDGVTLEDVFHRHFGSLSLPVVSGLPVGHIDDNHPLPLGFPARISGSRLIQSPEL